MPESWLTPEHLHVALNHLAMIGLAAAVLPLLIGAIRRDRPMVVVGLLIVVLFGFSMPFVMETGEEAEEKFEEGALSALIDADGAEWMETHDDRAHLWSKVVYGTASFAALALVLVAFKRKLTLPLGLITAVACLVCTASLVWVAEAGGKIRHPEFRQVIDSPDNVPTLKPYEPKEHEDH